MSRPDLRIAIVGATGGIGYETALLLARRGHRVWAFGRRAERLAQLEQAAVRTSVLDVRDEAAVSRAFAEVAAQWGGIDILIYSAGRGLRARIDEIDPSDWRDTMAVNLDGAFYCVCSFLAARAAAGQKAETVTARFRTGKIVIVSSMAGLVSVPGYGAYCASKHALSAFARALRGELLWSGVSVRLIHPYKVDSGFFESYERRPSARFMLRSRHIAGLIAAHCRPFPADVPAVLFHRLLNVFRRIYRLIAGR